MTLITKGMGAVKKLLTSKKVINRTTGKPFPKSIQDHMKAGDKRRQRMKKEGYKGPTHELYTTKKGSHRMKEVWKYNPYKKARPHAKRNLKKVVKEVAPVAAAGAAGVAYGGRDKKFGGGRIGFSRAGPVGNLPWVRGTSRPGVKKAPRGPQHKEAIKQEQKLKKKSDYKLKNQLKNIQKTPDKKFKSHNPATEKGRTRHGFVYEKRKSAPVKGSLGKKTYKSDWIKGHRAHQRMGLIKD